MPAGAGDATWVTVPTTKPRAASVAVASSSVWPATGGTAASGPAGALTFPARSVSTIVNSRVSSAPNAPSFVSSCEIP